MRKRILAITSCVACISLTLASGSSLALSLVSILTITVSILAVLFVIWVHILLSLNHKTGTGIDHAQMELDHFRNKLKHDSDLSSKVVTDHLPVILGRTLDNLLQQVLDYTVRDFVEFYLKQYGYKTKPLCDNIKEDIWDAVQNVHDRLTRVDHVTLIACDMITKITGHFEKIREAKALVAESNHEPLYKLSPHVMSKNQELHFLRHLSEILIMFLLPRSYSLPPAKYFLREILACKVIYVMVDNITDPDFFNQYVISYIESQRVHRKTFGSANTFDEFLKIIHKSNDIPTLKNIRSDIVNKIMQATTLQNMKRAKGIDVDAEKVASGINKSEINEAKKLKRYIDQLQCAKKECEKRLAELGWDVGLQYHVLPLTSILEHVLGRKFLAMFLETMASQGLVGYWTAVEDLKTTMRKNWHQIGAEIFYTYIRNPQSEIKVDKNVRKRMEAFLLGDKGPEVFYEVQNNVVRTLEDKYYQSFINSQYYAKMVEAIDCDEGITEVDKTGMDERQSSGDSSTSLETNMHVGEHSNYARRKLNQLQEKLNNKSQALQALQSSLKPESRVLKMLDDEVEWLQGEKRQLEAHLTRTEIWGENLGKWRAIVQSAEVPDEKESPQFVIVVYMVDSDDAEEEGTSSGWVVSRTLSQFQELHRKLRPLCAEIKGIELPSQPIKFLFRSSDRNSLEKAKMQIQKYLEFVLEDDRLNQSEAIYSFLSPSSEHLKYASQSPKKSKFSFSTLFKSNSEQSTKDDGVSMMRESEDDDISQYLDAPGSTEITDSIKINGHARVLEDGKDSVAEPLYSLMSEIFDMRGLFKYLRKTLIAFVQMTYGRTISRQIYDTISWCFSEKMLHYYLTVVTKSFWPMGELAVREERSESVKLQTALEARKLFVNNVPEVLVTLVGTSAAKNGAKKVFDTLQNKAMNKQLFYDLLEVFMVTVFPELNIDR